MSMSSNAPSRFPRVVRREPAHAGLDELGYVRVAVFLAAITAIEVGVYYLSLVRWLLILILVILAAVKFGTVAAFFMHLRFDGKFLTLIFLAGLATIAIVATIAVVTLRAMP